MIPVELRSPRLVLDQPGEADVDVIAEACARPEFLENMTTPWPYTRSDAEGFVREFVPGGWRDDTDWTWAPRLDAGRPALGMVGLHRHQDGALELGYWLTPDARGAGVVTEASRAVLSWAAAERLTTRFTWRAVVGNAASRSVAERIGFRFGETHDDDLRDLRVPHWHADLDAAVVRDWTAG